MTSEDFWVAVRGLVDANQRVGQAIFNVLSREGLLPASIVGSLDDPFYRVKTFSSGKAWMAAHATMAEDVIVRID